MNFLTVSKIVSLDAPACAPFNNHAEREDKPLFLTCPFSSPFDHSGRRSLTANSSGDICLFDDNNRRPPVCDDATPKAPGGTVLAPRRGPRVMLQGYIF